MDKHLLHLLSLLPSIAQYMPEVTRVLVNEDICKLPDYRDVDVAWSVNVCRRNEGYGASIFLSPPHHLNITFRQIPSAFDGLSTLLMRMTFAVPSIAFCKSVIQCLCTLGREANYNISLLFDFIR